MGNNLMVINQLVTQLSQAESTLLKLLLDEINACVYVKNLQGQYVYANRAALDLWQAASLDEILGKKDSDFFDAVSANSIEQEDRQIFNKNEASRVVELRCVQSSKQYIYSSIKKPLVNDQDQVEGLFGISTDITAQKSLEHQLKYQNALLQLVVDNVGADIYIKNKERRYLYANQRVAKMFGKNTVDAVIGNLEADLIGQEASDIVSKLDEQVFGTNSTIAAEESFMGADGQMHHFWSVKIPIEYLDGETVLIGLSTNITELHDLREKLEHQGNTDELTKLANRRCFNGVAEREFAHSLRHATPLSVITFDIDWFKKINDLYGHPVGDQVLQAIAQTCGSVLRKENILARVGGEEFAVLLAQESAEHAKEVAERLAQAIKAIRLESIPSDHKITASFGVASLQKSDARFDQLFVRADQALYLAKQNGRDRVWVLS